MQTVSSVSLPQELPSIPSSSVQAQESQVQTGSSVSLPQELPSIPSSSVQAQESQVQTGSSVSLPQELPSIPSSSVQEQESQVQTVSSVSLPQELTPTPSSSIPLSIYIDLGVIVQSSNNSLEKLRHITAQMTETKRQKYLFCHYKPAPTDVLHSHSVNKQGKSWNVHFQHHWLQRFPWLSYSKLLEGGLCRYCILFPQQPARGGIEAGKPGVLVLRPYKKPYSKALGKDGILNMHENNSVHRSAAEKVDFFLQSFQNPSARIDHRLLNEQVEQEKANKEILRLIVHAVEFLAKQGLPFRGNGEDKAEFADESKNRGNFVATLQLLAKGNSMLQKHLLQAKQNARYTSKTIQNDVIHIYASKIREHITKPVKDKNLPYTIIADEVTDPHSNCEIVAICVRYVDLTTSKDPHIKECLINFLNLERANATSIYMKILESLSHPSVSLDPTRIRGQAYDGAAVMSSEIAGVQAKIKELSPLALYTHCFSHCLNLSIAASCRVQEVRNLIALINEVFLFTAKSPKRQRFFEHIIKKYSPDSTHFKISGLCKTRWVERHTCLELFHEMYETLVIFWMLLFHHKIIQI